MIDRKVHLDIKGYLSEWNNDGFCNVLKNISQTQKFFNYLKDKFNGDDIFSIPNEQYKNISDESLRVLIRLLQGDDLEHGQSSLFNLYDFSIIPIEFISNVYELFIGKENQKEEGVYYTPLFLVDYILKETIEKHFGNNFETNSCVTLDPACGSGIFLVETLRKIIEQYRNNNKKKKLTPNILNNLVTENIYGIDKDPKAIQVAIFSIYLTLLDYQEPADIEKFKFPALKNTNFFNDDFFNTDALFETKLQAIEFDFIVGNPPWKAGALGKYGKTYIKERRKKDNAENKKYHATINNGEIVEGFVLRVSDFSSSKTKCALIVRSSILYNRGYKTDYSDFRRYWLEEFFVNKVVELASVRREVFDKSNDKSIAPASILFYQYAHGKVTDNNILEHITIKPTRFFSYFKIFIINRPDYKKVEQGLLKQDDWLFKTLVYGSYLDFNLIKRLKTNYPSIKKIISNTKKFIYGTEIQYSKTQIYDATQFHNYPFIDAYAIEPYFINPDKIVPFTEKKVHRIRNQRLFEPPMLLIRKGPDTKLLTPKSAICEKKAVYKDTLTVVKVFLKSDIKYLRHIEAILNSDIYAYFSIHTFASIGIEREQIQNYDKFSVPYIECDLNLMETIEKAKIEQDHLQQQQILINSTKYSQIQKMIDHTQNAINETIIKSLNFNEEEQALLDYALTINRPLITRTKKNNYKILDKLQKALSIRSKEIADYASIFLQRFKPNIDNDTQKFIVRIRCSNHIIGMFFEVVPINTKEENGIIWENIDDKKILSLLMKLSSEKVTNRLFVQKDIRGFEKKYFYLFKPNEKHLWHKAIAYLDAEDFMNAILKAGRKGE
ncbi:MAG: SAM-dependent methyltransferase [Planctomycetaceae bacterium]|nr:SAM-dependent methyltransferase [Planctomycetaceae bacterium]